MRAKATKSKKRVVVAVSGGFDPIHIGHVRYMEEAKKLGDTLVVILNNDHWLMKKKGFVFMPQEERKEIIEALACVDEVVITEHQANPDDMSVAHMIRKVCPTIFANGGDRVVENVLEGDACRECGTEMTYNIGHGGKVQSSSWLLGKFEKHTVRNDLKGR